MKEHLKQIAQKSVNADNWLIETIAHAGNLSIADATKVANAYIKHKLVKRDTPMQCYTFKHGMLLDAEIIANALHNS